ncbi:bifunctional 4-hydroxy-2-oxoglutarate aldolase/2-dehydro-3-deoxy-phosphogluconate aldolase [Microbacterium sp. 1P10UB]|uniref:bifunctional 4-hydroxy-2-oxoglutarate aldolase/2-dehydro-3-deoxy-phosphogluconate aldolase n=1 Tax=unclassified Microbacterium TaxID=2609290 RepID=UPI0039A3F300
MTNQDTEGRLARAGIIATLRAPHRAGALAAVEAMVASGITAIEVTYSTPDVVGVLDAILERFGDAVHLGVGTLIHPAQVAESAAAGAQFFVSPGFDREVYAAIRDVGGFAMIGAFTPTEVQTLIKHEVDVVKYFPGSIAGPAGLKALRGPFPQATYIPTGGVNPGNIGQWLAAGALAVGAGSELLPAAALASADVDALRLRGEDFVAALRAARSES